MPLTQEQALEQFKALRPNSEKLSVEIDITIGHQTKTQYYLWDRSEEKSSIVASSTRSWEHALALAKIESDFPEA